MAPAKRKAAGPAEAAAGKVAETTSTRVTRSVTRRVNSNSTESGAELTNTDVPTKKSKTAKVTGKQKRKKKKEEMKAEGNIEPEKSKVEEDVVESEKEVAEEKIEPEKEVAGEEIEPQKETAEEDTADGDGQKERTVVIEHCKQCKSFKTRADHVKDGLEKEFPGIKVLLNPEKPRRGCFEIREEGGEKFLSLLNLKRPFGKMKELDMDEVVADVVAKLK